ncbi:MAG: substrate-binding domain-containing protein [Chloroflexi bacterium]|nr:substrate-binding domain-containing protein [Chloroflexota bacterium]
MHGRRKLVCSFLAGAALASLALALVALPGLLNAQQFGDQEDGVEGRIAARQLGDGRAEVAIQVREADGDWSDRIRPVLRVLPAETGRGRWKVSSPVTLPMTRYHSPAAIDENPAVTSLDLEAAPELYCVVTHGHERDAEFWDTAVQAIKRWGESVAIRYRVHHSPIVEQQAEYVRQCVRDGAVAIGVTLAEPDGMAEAVSDAINAGLIVFSFNSGREDYQRLGIKRHISIDERAGGRDAAQRFAAAGVDGHALCVIHERVNVGLEERCDGFADAFPGTVERVYVAGVRELEATTSEIAERLRDADGPRVSGVLTLNAVVGTAALQAVRESGVQAALATFDQTPEVLDALADGEVLFAIDTLPYHQGWYIMATMLVARNTERIFEGPTFYGMDDASALVLPFAVTLTPAVFTADTALVWKGIFENIRAAREREAAGH